MLKPVVAYLGEIEGLKAMHELRQKKLIDFDYYQRKARATATRRRSHVTPHLDAR